jgi:histone H3/H4
MSIFFIRGSRSIYSKRKFARSYMEELTRPSVKSMMKRGTEGSFSSASSVASYFRFENGLSAIKHAKLLSVAP